MLVFFLESVDFIIPSEEINYYFDSKQCYRIERLMGIKLFISLQVLFESFNLCTFFIVVIC